MPELVLQANLCQEERWAFFRSLTCQEGIRGERYNP
jgi:hypothetical protein